MNKILFNFNNSKNLIFIITLLGLFLRFYKIEQNFIFSGEVGHNLLVIKNAYITKQIPLLGPPTSHPWLYFGPLYYWIYGPVLIFSNFNPLSHAYFGAVISAFMIIFNFITIKRLFNEKVATLSSFLIAVSPLCLEFSRFGRFFSIVSLLVYPFLYCLYEILERKRNLFLQLGLLFGAMFSFHFTPLMLVPFMVSSFTFKRYKPKINNICLFLLGSFITMSPFFIYDLTHNLFMTKSVLLWIPYRIAGFLGLYPKNNLSVNVIHDNSESVYTFITQSFIVNLYPIISILIGMMLLIIFVWFCKRLINHSLNTYSVNFILLWFIWGCIAVFVHGSPPIHYFLPILTAPIIIFTVGIMSISLNKRIKVPVFIFILIISILNFRYYFSNQWYYIPNESIVKKPYYVPYSTQKEIAKAIISDAGDQKFNLYRKGIYDEFEANYAQNYQYLLWLYGAEPSINNKINYTIYENSNFKNNLDIVFQKGDIAVIKDIKK